MRQNSFDEVASSESVFIQLKKLSFMINTKYFLLSVEMLETTETNAFNFRIVQTYGNFHDENPHLLVQK